MPVYSTTIHQQSYTFKNLKEVLAKASPLRSGDELAGVAARSLTERIAAQIVLANIPLKNFLSEAIIPYETDEVTRLIIDTHNKDSFALISHFTVGGFRDWLLLNETNTQILSQIKDGITPEMAAAVSKIMRNQDLILVAQKCRVVTKFRTTIGLEGRFSTRLQPNHPTDDYKGIAASMIDGLMLGSGDALIGINPATDNIQGCSRLIQMLDSVREKYQIPTQSCVLTHITNTIQMIENQMPVDLVFQSIAGTEAANRSFGIHLNLLKEGLEAGRSLKRGHQVMYFETGQGSALSANAHHGVDQQTCEARAYAVARAFDPFLVNTVVGFIGPEYLFDGKQIIPI